MPAAQQTLQAVDPLQHMMGGAALPSSSAQSGDPMQQMMAQVFGVCVEQWNEAVERRDLEATWPFLASLLALPISRRFRAVIENSLPRGTSVAS